MFATTQVPMNRRSYVALCSTVAVLALAAAGCNEDPGPTFKGDPDGSVGDTGNNNTPDTGNNNTPDAGLGDAGDASVDGGTDGGDPDGSALTACIPEDNLEPLDAIDWGNYDFATSNKYEETKDLCLEGSDDHYYVLSYTGAGNDPKPRVTMLLTPAGAVDQTFTVRAIFECTEEDATGVTNIACPGASKVLKRDGVEIGCELVNAAVDINTRKDPVEIKPIEFKAEAKCKKKGLFGGVANNARVTIAVTSDSGEGFAIPTALTVQKNAGVF